MLPKKPGLASTIGNAKDFSEVDLAKINRMYKCDRLIDLKSTEVINPPKARVSYYFKNQVTSFIWLQISPIYSPPNFKRPTLAGHAFYNDNKNPKKGLSVIKAYLLLLINYFYSMWRSYNSMLVDSRSMFISKYLYDDEIIVCKNMSFLYLGSQELL